jgi:hypothetical protein
MNTRKFVMSWFGADPGGIDRFGIAELHADGSFNTWCCSSVDEAVELIKNPEAIGIDCPMWWSSAAGGGRRVDAWLRETFGVSSGTVQSVNRSGRRAGDHASWSIQSD